MFGKLPIIAPLEVALLALQNFSRSNTHHYSTRIYGSHSFISFNAQDQLIKIYGPLSFNLSLMHDQSTKN